MKKSEQSELLEFIGEISFMLDDIELYLDTHPTCPKGLAAYNQYKKLRESAMAEYVSCYGPLCKYDVNPGNYFNWIEKPWPWEGECNC